MKFACRQKTFDIEGVSPDEFIYQSIVSTRNFYEIELLNYLSAIIRPDPDTRTVIIDVGANIGNHSVYFGAFLADHVVAIEPNPKVLPILERNLRTNIPRYTIYPTAVGEAESTGKVVLPENSGSNIGMAKVELVQDVSGDSSTVRVTTLDAVVKDWMQTVGAGFSISLLKIDVEGMEGAVLNGAEGALRAHWPHIIVEAAEQESFDRIVEYLAPLGYRLVYRFLAATPAYHFAHEPTKQLLSRVRRLKTVLLAKRISAKLLRELKGFLGH